MAGEIVLGYDGEARLAGRAPNRGRRSPAAFKRPLVIAFGYAPPPIGGDVADLSKVDAGHRREDHRRGGRSSRTTADRVGRR